MPLTISDAAIKVRLAAIGLKKVREKNRLAKKHVPAFREFFLQQRDLVLKQIKDIKSHFTETAPVKTSKAAPAITQAALDQFSGIWDDIEKATTGTLQDLILATEQEGMKAGGDLMAKTINPDGKFWSLENPRAVAWFKANGGSISSIKDIQATTADSLKRVITTALDEGWSYNDTAKEIRKLFDRSISRERAQTIAVYESAQAYEAGNREFAASLIEDGVNMEKQYQTSEDDLVSDLCQGNQDDGWIPLDQPHSSGVQNPPGHVNCRCYEIYQQAKGD